MRIVITGGPGFGKTSIVEELKKLNYPVVEESSRDLIEKLKKKEGKDPRENRDRFQKLIVERRIKDYTENNQKIVFFDRGVQDEEAYSKYYNREPTKECQYFCAQNKYDLVFIVPPWKEIHKFDELRHEPYKEAIKLHNLIVNVYKKTNHKIINLPKISITDRVKYVLKEIKKEEYQHHLQ